MKLRSPESLHMSYIGSRWWGGPDEGVPTVVTIGLRTPTSRTPEDVLDLFMDLVEPMSGGYRFRVAVGRDDVTVTTTNEERA